MPTCSLSQTNQKPASRQKRRELLINFILTTRTREALWLMSEEVRVTDSRTSSADNAGVPRTHASGGTAKALRRYRPPPESTPCLSRSTHVCSARVASRRMTKHFERKVMSHVHVVFTPNAKGVTMKGRVYDSVRIQR